MRRVVVTGAGLVTPLGVGVRESWSALLEGRSAVQSLRFDLDDADTKGAELASLLPCKVGARVPAEQFAAAKEAVLTNKRAQDPGCIAMAMCAAAEAVREAGIHDLLHDGKIDPTRAGVCVGSGIGASVQEVSAAHDLLQDPKRGLRRLSPYFVPRLLINLAAGHISIAHNLQGPNHSCVTACASGAHSIGDASRFIMFGDADVMVAGGTESSVNPLSIAGFSRLKALSTKFNDTPSLASRPFDKDRDGFVMGEGAGVVVLEELEHARKRGAPILAEITGYGLSGDAFHLTAPAEDGSGAKNCIKAALRNAKLNAADIDYINAHATSTPLGDTVEAQAVAQVIGAASGRPDDLSRAALSSTKGAIGHLLGAAGAVEAIFAMLSLRDQVVPPTANLENPDLPAFVMESLDLVAKTAQERKLRHTMSNSFGFGGTNTSLVFSPAP
ncbi:3-oxoacyl-acyl-carrier-protein synthase, mitochondrial [Hondaea fermentalgiana]|uniref:3-oxoacyl-[acyl-carrier-protein] synthase n=1 Tax=Hondaea fermentalgiana TaxID=2315210 RepID=A0A2R5GBZ0_9STRA|nr:3-oxoacyl-acyl-carrier-protein synthase, mitochondrial [Hondaea fermentalgiana]|eukprot:GBG28512.1 3-oxoacyl-acyl-carrier-protein synthase, mitochondrial [Hondaea fermentalgiana]